MGVTCVSDIRRGKREKEKESKMRKKKVKKKAREKSKGKKGEKKNRKETKNKIPTFQPTQPPSPTCSTFVNGTLVSQFFSALTQSKLRLEDPANGNAEGGWGSSE